MTTRRWMVAVAVVGLACFLMHRHRSLASIAAYHESRMVDRVFPDYRKYRGREIPRSKITSAWIIHSFGNGGRYVYFDRTGDEMTADEAKASIWHEAMARKYREASRYPWFPVMPDPPMPSKPPDPPKPE